jgi:hypothetical protein
MGESMPLRPLRRGRAQTLAIMIIALPVTVGTMGLATDVGNYFFNYVKLQTAADASVLSGAKYLPDQPCTAISTANMYASCFNAVAAAEVVSTTTSYGTKCPAPASTPVPVACATPVAPLGCTLPAPPPSAEPACNLTMQAHRTVAFYFARLVGVDHGTLNVSATATVPESAGAGSINNGLVPIGLQYTTVYSHGARTVLLFQPNPAGPVAANHWSALALGGKSFTTVFPVGFNAKVSLNDAIAPDRSATTTGPVSASIQSRISAGLSVDPSGSPIPPPSYTANDARVVTFPLVDWGAPKGCCKVQGFAEFWVDSVSNANVTGYWIANGVNGSPDPDGTAPLDGALAITLTE